jgi:diguanylate cyclase (GGDEF)-like protein
MSPENKPKINWLRGRLSWRVILSVFVTIVIVQGMILYVTARNYEQQQLDELESAARSSLVPLLPDANSKNILDTLQQPVANRLMRTTQIRGIAFYEPFQVLPKDVFGAPPGITPDRKDPSRRSSLLSADSERYDVVFGPMETNGAYVVVLRLDSGYISGRVVDYIVQTTVISLLLSAFITTVLILVLGKWMIEPILMLRNNLLGAARDPTDAGRYLTPYRRRDELGSVISSANKLIKQNAENLSRLNQQAQDKIFRVAFFDALTELPNRPHFLSKLDELLNVEAKGNRYEKLGVLVVDIDHFGDVNDMLGYEAGDELLKSVSARLSKTLHDAVMVARLSEDEFAAIISLVDHQTEEEIDKVFASVKSVFADTFAIQGNDMVLEATLGMSIWPNDADRAADLLKKAESALDQAKLEDKKRYCLYSPTFEQEVQRRVQMVRDLRTAVEEKQFALVYQPQFDAKTREIIGAEALLRWERPDPETGKKSFVRPDHFIPIAEQSGLIVPIGRWVVEEACRFAKSCQDNGIKPFRVAVNLSGIQFHRDDVVALTKSVLEKTGLAPHLLELEVTESAVMKDIEETIGLLTKLKELGVELAIDDFGTGYSSLSYLKRFPVHRLKVDRSFVMNVTENQDDASITSTIIQLGHAINLKVIAEGVETEGQVNFLLQHGCDEFQGYFFSKPLAPDEFRGFVRGYASPRAVA